MADEEIPIDERNDFFSALRDLDESIFNISSRFARISDNRLILEVKNKIPVELNCLLLKNAEIIASWHLVMKNREKHIFWNDIAKTIATAIDEVLYDKEKGAWFDWILSMDKNDYAYYITNLMPLYTIIEGDSGVRARKAMEYMMKEQVITADLQPNYLILPTSRQEMGGEWDFPYGSLLWNVFVVGGLRNASYKAGNVLATNLAHSLINTIYKEFYSHGGLLEHYKVKNEGAEERKYTRKESSGARESSKSNIRRSMSSIRESGKISASTLGATIDLLKTFGKGAKPVGSYVGGVKKVRKNEDEVTN